MCVLAAWLGYFVDVRAGRLTELTALRLVSRCLTTAKCDAFARKTGGSCDSTVCRTFTRQTVPPPVPSISMCDKHLLLMVLMVTRGPHGVYTAGHLAYMQAPEVR